MAEGGSRDRRPRAGDDRRGTFAVRFARVTSAWDSDRGAFPPFPSGSTEAGSDDEGFIPSQIGHAIARYLVVDEVGAGGMGVVYKAYDPDLGRLVALKLVRAGASSRAAARLQREARAIARLADPNVVTIYDVGEHGDEVYIVMELIDGVPLREWLAGGPRPLRDVLDVFTQAARGLAAAHDRGLVHRDFKPDNVLVGDDGRVRVVDFGLAQAGREDGDAIIDEGAPVSASYGSPSPSPALGGYGDLDLDERLTPPGAAVGTPRYMAPEQHRGHAVDARADQFAWGVALYEALTRHRPFDGNFKEMRQAVLRGAVRPFEADDGVPEWVRAVVLRALAVAPANRFASMDDVVAELTRDRTADRRAALNGSASTAPMVAAFPPPEHTAPWVHRLRVRLEEAWRKKSRGALAQAMAVARKVSTEARGAEYPPLYAAALYLVGNLEHRMGDSTAAEATLHEAVRIAASAGDDWQVANTWIFLVAVVGVGLGRTDEALALVRVAEVALERIGDNASLRSRLYNYQGATLAAAGRPDEAARAITQAVDLDEKTHGPGHSFLLVSLLNLAEVWLDAGRVEAARAVLTRAGDICRPDEDPGTALRVRWRALHGRALLDEGDALGARAELDRAIAVWERQAGREAALAGALIAVAACQRIAGDREGAVKTAQRALTLARVTPDRMLVLRAERAVAAG
jgi:tetratricopeptide (TPR) repeat protein/predicted Ser/Thr protein kinase